VWWCKWRSGVAAVVWLCRGVACVIGVAVVVRQLVWWCKWRGVVAVVTAVVRVVFCELSLSNLDGGCGYAE
jgi:hypothetical protein